MNFTVLVNTLTGRVPLGGCPERGTFGASALQSSNGKTTPEWLSNSPADTVIVDEVVSQFICSKMGGTAGCILVPFYIRILGVERDFFYDGGKIL